jgi:hypothetical protein
LLSALLRTQKITREKRDKVRDKPMGKEKSKAVAREKAKNKAMIKERVKEVKVKINKEAEDMVAMEVLQMVKI